MIICTYMEDKKINIRLSKEEYKIIKAASEVRNIGISAFMREVSKNFAQKGGQDPEKVGIEVDKEVDNNQVKSRMLEFWSQIIPMLDEYDFIDVIANKPDVGVKAFKMANYILVRCGVLKDDSVSQETSSPEVSQGNNPYAGWIYDGQLATDEGLVYWAKKVLPGGKEFKKDFLSGTPGSEMFDGLNPGDVIR